MNKSFPEPGAAATSAPDQWVTLYGDLLYQYCLPRVHDQSVAEDLVQDCFLSALRSLSSYRGEASEKNWLIAILKNKIIDYYRRKASGQVVATLQTSDAATDDMFTDHDHWESDRAPVSSISADKDLDQKELKRLIEHCHKRLKALQQEVFTLKYLAEMDSTDICKVLGISASNYWVLNHRARLQMRECIEKHWYK